MRPFGLVLGNESRKDWLFRRRTSVLINSRMDQKERQMRRSWGRKDCRGRSERTGRKEKEKMVQAWLQS